MPQIAQPQTGKDPFQVELYRKLNDSTMQRKFRRIRPWPVGVVFVERPGMTMDDIRSHFQLMKRLGFTCLKQCQLLKSTDREAVLNMALDEGISPFWYDEAGWEDPTPQLLKELGIDPDISADKLREHPAWLKRQDKVYRDRIARDPSERGHMPASGATDGLPGTLKRADFGIAKEAGPQFVQWLKNKYKDVETLKKAWNMDHCMVRRVAEWNTWDDVATNVVELVSSEQQEYRRVADVFRFKADKHLEYLTERGDRGMAEDPNRPIRSGGEMSLFLPFASRSTDMEGIASLMKDRGSFYPSIHPAWHYEEVDFEFARPNYMQAALAVDWFKGGWAGPWEATGGPQQLSGGRSPFVEETRSKVAGFTIDEGTLSQLMLSWIASGFKGWGQWCWNARSFGWEAGEFALLDRNQKPVPRTIRAGQIGVAARNHRDELWDAMKEPMVGLFQDFEAETFWAALARGGREMYKSFGTYSRIGASRALINANLPWEYVTARNLRAGLLSRYKSIYIAASLAFDEKLLELLRDYVLAGGRVVLDAPGCWYNYEGTLMSTDDGSPFEQLFGCRIGDFQYSRANHRPWTLTGQFIEGFTYDLQLTTAEAVERFDDGRPAVVEHKLGKGTTCVLGWQASLNCWRPGHNFDEQKIAQYARGPHEAPYSCDGAIVYRLAAPTADHYFFINDGPARSVTLDTGSMTYRSAEDPVSQEALNVGEPIKLAADDARWIRMVK